jgi:3-hydroxymyristoyl/3-hydroxydecanoyl-(acyl carrier protein) dehydratase
MIAEAVQEYIPQREPFVMIDALEESSDVLFVTSFTVRQGHIFVVDGFFTEPGLVENMAQTAAAGKGYNAKHAGGEPAVGYIGALKNLYVNRLPKVGDTLQTEMRMMHQIGKATVAEGKVFVNGEEIAGCEMKIFIQS